MKATLGFRKVLMATPYQPGELGSLGRAEYMLLRQHCFPLEYSPQDMLISADHDRCMMWDRDNFNRALKKYVGSGECAIGQWAREAYVADVLAFLKDVFKVDAPDEEGVSPERKEQQAKRRATEWTGFRILGTVNRSNGFSVFSLELFAKVDPNTVVYSGPSAPNVTQPKTRTCGDGKFYNY